MDAQPQILIPSPQKQGGSGHGWSYWKQFLLAPAFRYTDETAPEYLSEAARVGTLFHKLLEHYYRGDLASGQVALLYEAGEEDGEWQEALRLFAAYRERFPHDEFGQVVGCEVPIEAPDVTVVGVTPFTGRIDMVVRLDEAACDRIRISRQLVLEPGLYLLDTKTKKRRDPETPAVMDSSIQFAAYMMLWDALHPEEPCKGTIANIAVRLKNIDDSCFSSVFVPPPGEADQRFVKDVLEFCRRRSVSERISPEQRVGFRMF